MGNKDCLPPHIRDGKHADFLPGLRWMPRRWTSFCWQQPPRLLRGNQPTKVYVVDDEILVAAQPIPPRGNWQLSWPLYFAFTTKGGWSFRIGARWDDVDFYYTFPAFRLWKFK